MSKITQLALVAITLTAHFGYCWQWPNVWPWKSKPEYKIASITFDEPKKVFERNEDRVTVEKKHQLYFPPIPEPSQEAKRQYMRTFEGNYPGQFITREDVIRDIA